MKMTAAPFHGSRSLLMIAGAAIALLLAVAPASALEVSGRVVDTNGEPVPFVRIRIGPRNVVPYTRTVFTTDAGTFSTRYEGAAAKGLAIDVFRIGWKEVARTQGKAAGGAVSVEVRMTRTANVADQVPASAWLKGDPDSMAYQMTTVQCSNCHQLGADRVRKFSNRMADQPLGDRSETWVKRAADDLAGPNPGKTWKQDASAPPAHGRIAGWEGIVQVMRYVTMQLREDGQLRWGIQPGGPFFEALMTPATSLFAPRDMAIIVPNLARNFPVLFDTYTDYDDVERLGDYGVTGDTVIDEYVLPTFGWTREVALPTGSDKVWFVETDKDRLGALDPRDGSVRWYPVPGEGHQAPHTMNKDAEGNLWVALEDSFHVGRLNTKTGEWRRYPPPAGTVFGVTHDFAFDHDRNVATDADGRIYITDLGKNELWGIDINTGDIRTHRLPLAAGETHFHSLLYGAAIDTKRNRVWWAQLYGNAGSFDPTTGTAERILPFDRGAGPRRLAIQEDGTLWIPLFGAGQVVRIDPDTGEETGRYSIPDRGAGPYGITYDRKRQAIWAATCNSDRIYRLDIATGKWRHYPMPRKETFIRMIEVHPETGDVWTTYASLPIGKRDPKVFGIESANNIVIRLRPGD